MSLDWYKQIPLQFAVQLKQHKILSAAYPTPVNANNINYNAIAKQNNAGYVLLISLDQIGPSRRYQTVIPVSDMEAECTMTGQLIDVKHGNKVVWRHTANMSQPVAGVWDQPPDYPNLTKTIREMAEAAQQEILASFFYS